MCECVNLSHMHALFSTLTCFLFHCGCSYSVQPLLDAMQTGLVGCIHSKVSFDAKHICNAQHLFSCFKYIFFLHGTLNMICTTNQSTVDFLDMRILPLDNPLLITLNKAVRHAATGIMTLHQGKKIIKSLARTKYAVGLASVGLEEGLSTPYECVCM